MEDSAVLGKALERPTKAKEGMVVEQIREPRSEVHSTGPASPGERGTPSGLGQITRSPWRLNGASICAYGRSWITGEFMNRLLIVAIFIISTLPLYAQDQAPDAAKLKADTQKVASIIKADGAKTHFAKPLDGRNHVPATRRDERRSVY
jgi:hypothetical protein